MATFEMFELGESSAPLPALPEYKEAVTGTVAPGGQVVYYLELPVLLE